MGPWNDAPTLLSYAAATLKVDVSALPALWTTVATQALAAAYADILQVMSVKGYDVSTLDQWDGRVAISNSQGLYRLGSMGGGFSDYREAWFKQFDMTEWLIEFGVPTIAGVAVAAGGTDVGGVRFGTNSAGVSAGCHFDRLGGGCWPCGSSWPWGW